jgi:hypothetical protein
MFPGRRCRALDGNRIFPRDLQGIHRGVLVRLDDWHGDRSVESAFSDMTAFPDSREKSNYPDTAAARGQATT